MAATKYEMAIFVQDIAEESGCPSGALSYELYDGTGRLGIHTRARRVLNLVAGMLNAERHFHILGLMSVAESAKFLHDVATIE